MRKTLVALVLLLAIMVGAGAAGTPVNGDDSIAATTAGINLGTPSAHSARPIVLPQPAVSGLLVVLALLLLAGGALVVGAGEPGRDRSVLRYERRVTRGPPAPSFA